VVECWHIHLHSRDKGSIWILIFVNIEVVWLSWQPIWFTLDNGMLVIRRHCKYWEETLMVDKIGDTINGNLFSQNLILTFSMLRNLTYICILSTNVSLCLKVNRAIGPLSITTCSIKGTASQVGIRSLLCSEVRTYFRMKVFTPICFLLKYQSKDHKVIMEGGDNPWIWYQISDISLSIWYYSWSVTFFIWMFL